MIVVELCMNVHFTISWFLYICERELTSGRREKQTFWALLKLAFNPGDFSLKRLLLMALLTSYNCEMNFYSPPQVSVSFLELRSQSSIKIMFKVAPKYFLSIQNYIMYSNSHLYLCIHICYASILCPTFI